MWTPATRRRHSREHLRYASDVSDEEWALLEPHLPAPCLTGRPRAWPMREIVNAIFYVLRSGCAWRLLPDSFPPRQTVYGWFLRLRDDCVLERLNHHLVMLDRARAGGLLADGLASRRAAFGRLAGGLHRDTPRQRGHEDDAKQDRPQRRQGAGPDHAHGVVQAGPRQEPSVPAVALAPSGAPHGPERDALDRERGAGGPAGRRPQVGNPEPSGVRRARARPHGRGCLGEAARCPAAYDPRHDVGPVRPPDQ